MSVFRGNGPVAWWARAGLALVALCAAAVASSDTVELNVKPVLCITDSREEACELSISISWQSETAGEFCLHSDLADEAIRCWHDATSGALVEERIVRETFAYWLTAGVSGDRIAEVKLEVMTTDSDDRRRSRRRRHVWDIL